MATKRGNGEGSIGQYRGRWMARYVGVDGKRRALYGATRAEVAKKLAAAIRDRDTGRPAVDDRLTVAAFLKTWLEASVRGRNRPSTYISYAGHVNKHINPVLGRLRLSRLTPSDVEQLIEVKLKEGLSPSTVTRVRSTLRRALSVALREGLVVRNVAALADPPRQKPHRVTALSVDDARALLAAAEGHRFEALFALALTTGLRRGELLGLQWSDVDLSAARLTVSRALQRVGGELKLVEPKTAKSARRISLPPLAVEHLQTLHDWHAAESTRASTPWNSQNLVFTTSHGTPLDGSNVTHALQRLLHDAGLPRIRFHDLRHTCASLLLAQGTHMRIIMEQLGHSQISLTMNTYSHVMPEALDDAAELMQDILTSDRTSNAS